MPHAARCATSRARYVRTEPIPADVFLQPRRSSTRFGPARVSHVGLNDNVVEGLELRNADGELIAFSVQYHPEAAAGPHDASYLFDRFIDMMTAFRQGRRTPEPAQAPAAAGEA